MGLKLMENFLPARNQSEAYMWSGTSENKRDTDVHRFPFLEPVDPTA